jgi:hypothetical protein
LTTIGANDGVIEITDSATIDGDLTITLEAQQDLTIRAADGARPVINGTVTIASAQEAEITLTRLMVPDAGCDGRCRIPRTTVRCRRSGWAMIDSRPLGTPSVRWAETAEGRLLLLVAR